MAILLFECNGIGYYSDDVLRFFNFSTSTVLYRGGLFLNSGEFLSVRYNSIDQ